MPTHRTGRSRPYDHHCRSTAVERMLDLKGATPPALDRTICQSYRCDARIAVGLGQRGLALISRYDLEPSALLVRPGLCDPAAL